MYISNQRLKEFGTLYQSYYGTELEPDELFEKAHALLTVVRHTYTHKNEYEKERMD